MMRMKLLVLAAVFVLHTQIIDCIDKSCGYGSIELLRDEGIKVGNTGGYDIDLDQCKQHCNAFSVCKSFTWCSTGFVRCHMKGKYVKLTDARKGDPNCRTYYPKMCNNQGKYLSCLIRLVTLNLVHPYINS